METAADEIRLAWRRVVSDVPHQDHDDVAAEIVDDLLARHSEPHRRYHTAEHVAWVLRHVDALALSEDPAEHFDRGVIMAAALFHDVVYDPRSATNEADSAELAEAQLKRLGWSNERCASVAALILATAGHEASTPAEAVLVDADLAVLGGSPAEYQAYRDGVRAEYAHVSGDAWRLGRASVLRSLVERPQIYATPTMARLRERQARGNLQAELDTLHD